MFNSDVLEIGLGLVLFFLLASLMATAVRELIEAILKTRAMDLERGVRELLDDPRGVAMAQSFFDHAHIFSLFRGQYDPSRLKSAGLFRRFLKTDNPLVTDKPGFEMPLGARRSLPTYIPAGLFATAIIDLVGRGSGSWPYPVSSEPLTLDLLRQRAAELPSPRLQRAVLSAIDNAEGEFSRVKTNLEAWFNGSMDRASGAYKRRTQAWLLAIGLFIAVAFNLDAVTVAGRLVNDPILRDAAAARAEKLAGPDMPAAPAGDTTAKLTALKEDLTSIGYPIGWRYAEGQTIAGFRIPVPGPQGCKTPGDGDICSETVPYNWLGLLFGWLVTAAAISLGAPFWFDVLNKVMVIRSTVKPREKSREEASEDRQAPAADNGGQTTVLNLAGAGKAPEEPDTSPPSPPLPVAGFEPEQWKPGFTNKGEVL
ncbi:MAG: hypothetical protein KF842_12630 [Caulobacter sp.]|nr:hypothetical protein [Caulobacter sp.]